ncbi:E3 ubiquitin-protein ligase rnf213-alpha-like [Watersipora subatra]|uniref:E3 ubiquitin-protein ligase rnf213-alpha-like n=1 Tax=Watersipora subatra TaxID=2589382 RepID=UPI00355B9444
MGETGCGKTKLIEFMSKLQVPTPLKGQLTTMVTVKVHGGTTEEDIIRKVYAAQDLAMRNRQICQEYVDKLDSDQVPSVYTILFLDEANTTEAIGLVKEILCDGRMRGEPLDSECGLKIIAACNPYRRHTPEMIEKLKKAGLGYSVSEEKTKDKFGQIPMRHLVYRVQPLSQSLLPLVWDFGALRSDLQDYRNNPERSYIIKIVVNWNQDNKDGGLNFKHLTGRSVDILTATQAFMREQKDECSFVSLRDIHRILEVCSWFYAHRYEIFPAMDKLEDERIALRRDNGDDVEEIKEIEYRPGEQRPLPQTTKSMYEARCLLLGLGVCYLARLEEATRIRYAEFISAQLAELIGGHLNLITGHKVFFEQVELCQDVFVNHVIDAEYHKNIAKNKALKENVFMMIVCIENRIPLFLVGKPGSSKSLSKAMVVDAMKGTSSKSDLFKRMKRVYMVSFQCSRHATPAGIVGVFEHCAKFQKGQDLKSFVSVVVLDEVGLAEDSENMPLKTLHPLLEDGCEGNTTPEEYMKCAFIGISNWALDPAKMNRGILVQRGTPDDDELAEIAAEICQTGSRTAAVEESFMRQLARGYLSICSEQKPEARDLTEFFGLRDFYSLMKMVVNFAATRGGLTGNRLEHSIKRNFGGFDPALFDPMRIFHVHCPTIERLPPSPDGRPPTDSIGLIQSSLSGADTNFPGMESRYLLILTESLSVLSIILDEFASQDKQPEVVFGSRFRDDISYTQICQNIYRIKTCMDMGKPVILLNLDDLYESLYDALNQYFSTWGDKKFVDLGLGTHRVKAFVHDNFRLVVIADKTKVLSQFPIPLINRLEKHYVSATSLLTAEQKDVKDKLEDWCKEFVAPRRQYQMNTCPLLCDGCGNYLHQPFKLPCLQHFIGGCCREAMFRDEMPMQCPVDHQDISPEFDWTVDRAALENRQYFENATPETVFIGYSSETMALAVRQATTDIARSEPMDVEESSNEFLEQVVKRAKQHLLQIATGESVLRLDRTRLFMETKWVEKVYMEEQQHENLFQYLKHHMSTLDSDQSSFIQVTSFAELMVEKDVMVLRENLKLSGFPIVVCSLFLKNFVKEDQFTETVRQFYEKMEDTASKLLIVQCETANENGELLDSVRYIIQRESEIARVPTRTVLLLTLPRGCTFSGYQGGKWSCVHIDDPRSPIINLPSISRCLELTPSKMIASLQQQLSRISQEEAMATDDDGMSASDDLLTFLKQCLPVAVSVIKSDQMYDRVGLLKQLFNSATECQFLEIFLEHAHKLLSEQGQYISSHWVKADAAKASNMKQSETLRHAVEDSLERAFVPALAAVISFVDVRENLKLLLSNSPFKGLWLQIFSNCDKLGLTFDQLTKHSAAGTSKLPKSYKILEVGDGHQQFRLQFPFSWLVKDTIDKLIGANEKAGNSLESMVETLVDHFESHSVIGKVIQSSIVHGKSTNMYDEMLKAYLNDFVFMAYPCANTTEHLLVVQTITNSVLTLGLRKISFVHIHAAFVHMRQVMNNLAVVFNLIISHGDQLIKMTYQEVIQQQKQQQTQSNVSCDIIALYRLVTHVKGISVRTLVSDPYEFMCQVEQCRPVVQQVIESSRGSPGIDECRNIWTLLELKKLYVEHVVAPANVNKAPDKRKTYKLPSLIKNVTNANFQSIQAFEQVVHSLQETVMEGIRSLYENCPARCPVCIQSLDAPVRLPCQHILCEVCAAQLHICSQNDCGKEIPPDSRYNPTSENMSPENLDEFTWLRDRLNKFFMYFVSELVFASEPEQAILEWLVDRVTFRAGTRQFGLFNSSEIVDASPVLRSYLLKLLLRCEQSKAVTLSLDTIIKSWHADKSRSHVQSLVLLMDCHKDLSEYQRRCEQLEVALIAGLELLRTNVAVPSVDTLKALADLQNALLQSVELITSPAEYELTAVKLLEEQLRRFLIQSRSAGHLQPGYMIARQLLNIAGKSYLKDLLNTPQNYLVPGDIKDSLESFTVPDALSLYGGDCYVKAKSAIDLVIISARDETAAREVITAFKKECGEDSNLIMQVLFTRITRTFAQNVAVGPQVCELLYEELQPSKEPNSRKLMKMLLDPHGLPKEMDVKQSRGINLGMLVLKLYSCLGGTSPKADLNPLAEIVNQPLQAATRYLPTMADNQYEIYQESIRLALQSPNENPVAYRCPNGHPYVIGNCGRPYTTAKCHDCGAQIGGQAHRAHAGNQTLGENDSAARSRKGHILGRQTSRGAAAPERDLSALSCAVMRCLTHLSMLTSSLFYAREVLDMIQPALVREEDVIPFLDAHIQLDLQHIARCCACSNDDCVLLLHAVIEKMSTGRRRGTMAELSNIEERKVWEKRFDANYIKPIFDQSTENVAKLKAQLQTAKQDGMKNALRTDGSTLHPNFLMSSGLWAYRRPLTLPAVQNLLHSAISSCPNLTNMADNYLSLTAVKHLPNILRLLRVLSNTFHSQYSRADAANTSLMEFIDSNSDIPDLETLVDSFIQAWNLMIECSMGTVVRFSGMTRNSALSEILFDQHASRKTGNAASAGSSPLHLVRFLVEAHNKLLSFVDDNSKSSVPLVSVNTGNVISLSGKQELLDLILTHSEYELQETTSCRYNWQAIEREVLQKYISNKPKISFTTDQLPCFVYQEDFNLHNQMQALQDSQERLEVDMQEHIINSLTPRISVLTIHLKELKVVINFLSVMTHIDGEESLDEYMNSTFGRESGYLSKDVKLKHVKHVWLLVKYTQADLLMKQFQEPFDDLSPDYRAPLNDHIRMQLNDCSRYNSSKTKILVRLLFEYISLRLNKTAVAEEQEEPTQCLSDGITQFIMRSGDDRYELIGELPALPSALKVKHASQAWAYIWTRFTTPVL